MTNAERAARIERLLRAALDPESLAVVDQSHLHEGHAGARDGRGHFLVEIVARAFEGRAPLERHRMIYQALGEMMTTDVHALAIRARTPEEP